MIDRTVDTVQEAAMPPIDERRVDPEEWDEAVADIDGPQIVVGGPGTGKTEFLVRRALHLVAERRIPTDQVLLLSFGRRGVADLAARIRSGLDLTDPPVTGPPAAVSTFHGLAAGILESHGARGGWDPSPQILTGPEQVALVRTLLAEERPSAWSVAFSDLLGSATFAGEVTDFLLRASEQMLHADDIAELGGERADWRGLPQFIRRYHDVLRRRHRIDYGTLLAEATAIVENADTDLLPYRFILVDEYQDTTVSQARLLAGLVGDGNLTAAADPYQSIYSFRGAALQNVARFPETFSDASGTPARRIVLTTSFRTPRRILTAAERVTAHDIPGAAGPVTPVSADGAVDILGFEQHTEEAEWIATEVVRLHLEERLPYRDIGVFTRTTRRFIPELSRVLQRRGVPHDPPTARLAEQPAVRFLLDAVTAATTTDAATLDRVMRRLLLGPWFAAPLGTVRDLERMRMMQGLPWADALRKAMPEATELARLVRDSSWATQQPAVEGAWEVWSRIPQLAVVTESEHQPDRGAWASLIEALTRWNERNPDATLVDYARLLLEEEFEARPLLSHTLPEDDRLTVTTLHQAKGLELEVVFIADAVEGVFPDLRLRDSLLGVRHLLPDVPHESAEYRRFRLQEERRLAYTAMTRARRRVVWTATSSGFEEGAGIPSRFLALVAGTNTVEAALARPVVDRPPVTAAEAEARFRRLASDPEVPGPQRLAAIEVLISGVDHGLRPAKTFAGMLRPRPDTGLVGGRLVLSPTQADGYDRCPRRYALQRRLGVGDESSAHAALGSMVHRVLERVERNALEAGRAHGTVDDAIAELDLIFDPDLFGPEPLATAWKRRAAGNLRSLYGRWPGKGQVVEVERKLETEIGGVSWFGVADRIEHRAGKLVIVDYKTSSTPVSKAEAASSLQLGFYLLAARRDPDLLAIGEPVRAELWYPWAGRDAKSVPTRFLSVEHLGDVERRLEAAATGIQAELWPAKPSEQCDRCTVRSLCPAFPDGREGWVA